MRRRRQPTTPCAALLRDDADLLRGAFTQAFETRTRDALLDAMIPAPGNGLPALADVERGDFWQRFASAAPWTLRLGFRAATWVVGGVVPLALGHRATFARLDADARDDVLHRTARLPGGDALLLLVKLVACFAYFDDQRVQSIARAHPQARPPEPSA